MKELIWYEIKFALQRQPRLNEGSADEIEEILGAMAIESRISDRIKLRFNRIADNYDGQKDSFNYMREKLFGDD